MASLMEIHSSGNPETVIIDGETYKLTDFDDLSALDQHKLRHQGQRIVALMEKPALSGKEEKELGEIGEGLFDRIAGEIPSDVRDKLKPGARQRLVTAFFTAYARSTKGEDKETETDSQSGQDQSSPGSNGSTEASPQDG